MPLFIEVLLRSSLAVTFFLQPSPLLESELAKQRRTTLINTACLHHVYVFVSSFHSRILHIYRLHRHTAWNAVSSKSRFSRDPAYCHPVRLYDSHNAYIAQIARVPIIVIGRTPTHCTSGKRTAMSPDCVIYRTQGREGYCNCHGPRQHVSDGKGSKRPVRMQE